MCIVWAGVDLSWSIDDVPMSAGTDESFSVEINPEPRVLDEVHEDMANPYADNTAETSVEVRENTEPFVCETRNTDNQWTTDHEIYEYEGEWGK
ncbi:hypothetical protein [Alkalibacillus salilacus]|uniref:Ig-like domain-containing protein n=1 Tax=Alkalibacillus salilacus TaxID=284582 RepID=A0ABT9VI88_9BACI|nr:hypothetical protein [Alkalibacillus salilacus]MDQ0160666.1 hypothetical protein [Alkalibacillus salilacus]